ncbi:serine hydrolase domain-containing protein [Nonomuraea rhizosphaerae]|uniref:serine hydrolase domain-containing protein n=1 Tax=Nonomuraea rhizosphaerae TaxID=2665663 RepID=UPI001C5F4185|nr:serine hydrolase [Nonomuraea rhizosphaerae]
MHIARYVLPITLLAVLTGAPATSAAASPVSKAERADVLRPSAHPVKLRTAPRKLTVTYTYQGQEHTLNDFLSRTRTNGFVVLDGQDVVLERYRDATRDTRFQSWSMAKSFTSAAVGIALAEKRIGSVDDRVDKYLPELARSGYAKVTVRELLRMSSGIEWDELTDAPRLQAAVNKGASVRKLAARQVRGWEPGSRFEYTSMNSFVLARLLTKATGVPYHRYVERKIWRPAGMESWATVGHDSRGDSLGYCCYYATDRDFARFGLLYLRGGKAGGRQVVPASWVKASLQPSPANPGYGLHWWLGGSGGDFMAAGFGGQYIYVSPKHDVVIVKSVTSGGRPDQQEALTAFRAVAAEVARTR